MMNNISTKLFSLILLTVSVNAIAADNNYLEEAKKGDRLAMSIIADQYCKEGNYRESLYWREQQINSKQQQLRQSDITEQQKQKIQVFLEFDKMQLADSYAKGSCDPYQKPIKQLFLPDYQLALRWYQDLSFTKNPQSSWPYSAKFKMAEIYFWGEGGVKQDVFKAKIYYKELAEIPDNVIQTLAEKDKLSALQETRGNARMRLAQMHFIGKYASQDDQQAYFWAKKGLEDNNPYAVIILAILEYQGSGTAQNKTRAVQLIKKVCDIEGDEYACLLYQQMKANRPVPR
ncbi:Sel1 repeat-containing protein [Volucribacter psittacicida]|uniref:Sel1 repeat-containing protein n=1 Tax=Volucribacter psittacicida TaxID=203482 RepID=A0A4R1G1Q6_9PAST|nr:SEL1-like repeat protein [Volucribacter psittacicida]TCJ98968.1 Sel1 repeat-containing protein [Volucribacter psittacicida]